LNAEEKQMRAAWFAGAWLVACSGGGDSDGTGSDGTGTGTGTEVTFDDFIALDGAPAIDAADAACFTPGADWASTSWLTQNATPGGTFPLTGGVEDFESGDPVDDATVELWFSDVVSGVADTTSVSDVNGTVTFGEAPTCAVMTYRVTTDPILAESKTTYKAHQVYSPPPGGTGSVTDAIFLSVSSVTYQLIPSILGVSVDDDKAVIAGTAFGCGRDPSLPTDDDSDKLEGVQVIVYDEAGNIPQSLTVNYFVDDFPNRDQPWTSPDGLWVAANVPAGNLRVEMWGLVGGAPTLLGATQVLSEAGSINIGNLFTGYGDGVKYPEGCVAP